MRPLASRRLFGTNVLPICCSICPSQRAPEDVAPKSRREAEDRPRRSAAKLAGMEPLNRSRVLSRPTRRRVLTFPIRVKCRVDPTGTNTVYAYRCDDGHHHEILGRPSASESPRDCGSEGPVPPRSALRVISIRDTERLALNLSGACVAAERRAGEVMAVRREAEPLKARADQRFSFITPSDFGVAGRNYCTAATFT